MAQFFAIDGYWKDDHSEFSNYVVKDMDEVEEDEDEDIFFYGLSEANLKEAIQDGERTAQDFVITSYRKLK